MPLSATTVLGCDAKDRLVRSAPSRDGPGRWSWVAVEELEPSARVAMQSRAAQFLEVAAVLAGSPVSLAALDPTALAEVLKIELPDWETFRPASAGHSLVERGFMTTPDVHCEPDTMAGWHAAGNAAYLAPLMAIDPG